MESSFFLFDPRTVFLIAGMLYLLIPVVVWLALRALRSHTVRLWCLGGQLFGMSVVLFGIRNLLPAWLTYDVAMLLLYTGCALRVQALRSELGRPFGRLPLAALILVPFAIYEILRFFSPSEIDFFVWSHLNVAVALCWVSLLCRELGEQQQLRSASGLSYTYLPVAALLLIRVVQVLTGHGSPDLLKPDAIAVAVTLMGGLSAVLGNISFLGMFVERASRLQVQQAEEKARREQSELLGRQITHLDRQRSMGMLATSLAHELSQPLTHIYLIAERAELDLGTGHLDVAEFSGYVADIQSNNNHAMAVMNRMRNFIKDGPPEAQRVCLQEVCDDAIRLMSDWLQGEQVRLQWQPPETPMHVLADPVQIAQVLVNLIRNASQAAVGQDQPGIVVSLRRDAHTASIEVQDNGPGFSPQALQNKGHAFFSTKPDGLGVGLSISRQIAEQHLGSLSLRNAPQGGAIVTFTLPLG